MTSIFLHGRKYFDIQFHYSIPSHLLLQQLAPISDFSSLNTMVFLLEKLLDLQVIYQTHKAIEHLVVQAFWKLGLELSPKFRFLFFLELEFALLPFVFISFPIFLFPFFDDGLGLQEEIWLRILVFESFQSLQQ